MKKWWTVNSFSWTLELFIGIHESIHPPLGSLLLHWAWAQNELLFRVAFKLEDPSREMLVSRTGSNTFSVWIVLLSFQLPLSLYLYSEIFFKAC